MEGQVRRTVQDFIGEASREGKSLDCESCMRELCNHEGRMPHTAGVGPSGYVHFTPRVSESESGAADTDANF